MGFSNFFSRTSKRVASVEVESGGCEECALTKLPVGQPACLVCVNAGKRLKRRLAELGLTPGVEMIVLQNQGGPLLLSVRDSRLALGRGMADKVSVIPAEGCGE
jgi:Fe2+ transport system protein FeoA